VTPTTFHASGVVDFEVVSTPGLSSQLPARRSVPNQLTTSETLVALGSVAAS